MGMSHEINGNTYFLSQTTLQSSDQNMGCGETVIFNQNSFQAIPQLVSGVELNTLNAFNTTFNTALDLNQSVIIDSNERSAQQIIIVSSPMDLMTVQTQQPMIANDLSLISRGISTGNQLNVIEVPTNLLLTDNNLIVIPQEGLTLEVPAIASVPTQQTIEDQLNVQQLMLNLNQCFAINNKMVDNSLNANQYFSTNPQILGIIDGNTNEPKLLTTDQTPEQSFTEDLNTYLANAMASNVEQELDPNEAKSWLNDSLIAYRAMVAFKKVMPNETSSHFNGCRLK